MIRVWIGTEATEWVDILTRTKLRGID